jgi:hypothetical protein
MNYNDCKIDARGFLNPLESDELMKSFNGIYLPYLDIRALNEILRLFIRGEDFLRWYFRRLTENMDRSSQVAFENLIDKVEAMKYQPEEKELWLKILREIQSELQPK